jgi:hypothetical protein
MPQKQTHQTAMIALRSAAPASAGFGPSRVGQVPSAAMAASSLRPRPRRRRHRRRHSTVPETLLRGGWRCPYAADPVAVDTGRRHTPPSRRAPPLRSSQNSIPAGTDRLVPSTNKLSFLFNTDFFAMFKVSKDKLPGQYALASSVMDPGFQESFNLVKGSIPARSDVPGDKFDSCGQKSMAGIRAAEKSNTLYGSLAHGYAQPAAVQRAIFDVVTNHFNSDQFSREAVEQLVTSIATAKQ